MALFAVLAVRLQPRVDLKGAECRLGFRAEIPVRAVAGQRVPQRQQQLLQGAHVAALRTVHQQTAAQRGFRGRLIVRASLQNPVAIVEEGQPVPARPAAPGDLCLDTAVRKALPFHGLAVSDIVAHVPFLVQRQPDDLRERVDAAPVRAFALCIGEHGIGSLVGAAVGAVAAGVGPVRTDGLQNAQPAAGPGIPLDRADAVGADLFLRDVLPVARRAAGGVMRGILGRLSAAQAFRTLVQAGAVPVGLAHHGAAEGRKVLVGHGRLNAFRHGIFLLSGDGGHSPPSSVPFGSSMRSCSWARMALSFSGMGRPRWPAFSSTLTPSLER